ncbi:MAG: hypothetical protein ABI967_03135 [bacterium]
MARLRYKQFLLIVIGCFAVVVSCPASGALAFGQSGRRIARTEPLPAPLESPAPQPITEQPALDVPVSRLYSPVKLLIGKQHTSKHQPSEEVIFASFIKRLTEFKNLDGNLIGEMTREHAAKRARQETDAYVVLVQFVTDKYQRGKLVLDSPDLEIKYFVFAPLSLQPQLKGKVYYQAIGGGQRRKSTWPEGPPVKITVEAAGIEAAERLHDWLAENTEGRRN